MPPAELAARILTWFSSQKHLNAREEIAYKSIAAGWLKTGSARTVGGFTEHDERPFKDPDARAVAEAVQVLEHASLPMRAPANIGLTRLGHHALQTSAVRESRCAVIGPALPAQ